jgi:hypothetical protein
VLLGVTAATTGRLSPTAVTAPRAFAPSTSSGASATAASEGGSDTVSDAEADALEARITGLVASGADEAKVRDLVREAVRLARRA